VTSRRKIKTTMTSQLAGMLMLTDVPVNAMMLASIVDGRCYVASQPDTQIQQVATIDRKIESLSLLPLANKVDCEYRPQGIPKYDPQNPPSPRGWLGSRVVSVLDSGAEGPGFKSHPRRCRVTVLGKSFTPIVLLFSKQRNW